MRFSGTFMEGFYCSWLNIIGALPFKIPRECVYCMDSYDIVVQSISYLLELKQVFFGNKMKKDVNMYVYIENMKAL